jgi:hypothetical protein
MPQTIDSSPVITLDQWIDSGLTYNQYENDRRRCFLRTTRACQGQPVQIEWDSILEKRKAVLRAKLGDPAPKIPNELTDILEPDPEAHQFYTSYKLNDGRNLPLEAVREYHANAAILNAIAKITRDSINMRKALGNNVKISEVWENATRAIKSIDRREWPHTLPENNRRLRDKLSDYQARGYESLIHKNFCNQSARKVSKQMEDLFIALYTTKNRHFAKTVRDLYLQFLSGSLEVANVTTGELFNRADFFDEEGEPLYISESTTWSYLSKPVNRQVINKFRNSAINHRTKDLPYNHRHKPNFTLSKISFDDRDLPRKTAQGFEVKCYYAYEPLSQCIIAWSHSREKNIPLIIDCFRSLLSFCQRESLPWPGEAEVERHLMTQLKDPLEAMFPHVRWCNPQNSREKRAEHGIKSKKYGVEKLLQDNIGRWSNKHDAYQVNQDENKIYEYDDLVADDIYSINFYNNQPHPSFTGKTRIQVLKEMINPKLGDPALHILLRHIGNRTETSIRNFDFVRVQYKGFAIDSDKVLKLLAPNNYDVQAYWLPDEKGEIQEVYLYQGSKFLCKAAAIETYNEALIERTDRDEEIRTKQAKRQSHTRKRISDRANEIPRVEVIRNMPDFSEIVPEIMNVSPEEPQNDFDINNITADSDYWEELGRSTI